MCSLAAAGGQKKQPKEWGSMNDYFFWEDKGKWVENSLCLRKI